MWLLLMNTEQALVMLSLEVGSVHFNFYCVFNHNEFYVDKYWRVIYKQ